MATRPDVTVFGAGIFGLTTALALARSGRRVRVVDPNGVGAGASGGPVGALAPHMPEKWNAKKAFQLQALLSAEEYWRAIEAKTGLSSGYGRVGRITPIHGARGRTLAAERSAASLDHWQGRAEFELVDHFTLGGAQLREVVRDTLTARLYPPSAIRALWTLGSDMGVVYDGESRPDDARGLSGVDVVAAGHASSRFVGGPIAGLVSGVKGQAALLASDAFADEPIFYDDGLYVVGHPSIGTAIGSTSEKDWVSDSETDDRLDALIAKARARFPDLEKSEVLRRWAGVRPRGRYPDPLIGWVPGERKTLLLTGGFKIGFGIAHEMADAACTILDENDPDLPERFRLETILSEASPR